MKTAVFVGPSIRSDHRPNLPHIEFVPPIRRGDLSAFTNFDVVVILDGEFNQSLSVSPKEILRAVNGGQRIIGASSMGALRASELHAFGMRGVGWVFERFAQSPVRRDDDVAMTYDPFTMAPVTVPMVNVIYWMELAVSGALISARESRAVVSAARKIFFADRSEKKFLNMLDRILGANRVRTLIDYAGGCIPDIKEIDGLKAIALSYSTGSGGS
jgi:TfuA protein